LHAIRLWIARFYAHTEQLSELRIARNTRSVTQNLVPRIRNLLLQQ